jgi:hypothetical protein
MLVAALALSNAVFAETFTYIVPAGIDGGNGKWAQKFTKEWNKHLKPYGHDIVLRYIPGTSGAKGFAEWQTKYSNDDTVLIQSTGMLKYITTNKGWKGYKPTNHTTVGGQIQSTYQFIKTNVTPGVDSVNGHIDGGSEVILDAMAANMMACGPTLVCKNPINWVSGFKSSGERRKAFLNNELQLSRDGFAHMKKTYKKELKSKETKVWYTHGMTGPSGTIVADSNMPHLFFPKVYKETWGVAPSGDYYEAYKQTLRIRNGLGKMIYTKKDNAYYDVLVKSFNDTVTNGKTLKVLNKKLGTGKFLSGTIAVDHVNSIWGTLTADTYRSMIEYRKGFGENSIFIPEIVGLTNNKKNDSYSWVENLINKINSF